MPKKFTMLAVILLCSANIGAAELTGTLKRVADNGELRIGFVPDAPPMSFVDGEGNPTGYSISLCKTVASAIKAATGLEQMRISYTPYLLPEERLAAIEDGRIDLECGASTVTLSRRERVDFSLMTYITGGAVVSKTKSPVASISDLDGKKIAVIQGTTTHTTLEEFAEVNDADITLHVIGSHDRGMELLEQSKVDGYATDRAMIVGQVLRSVDAASYAITSDVFSFEPYGLMMKRGDTDFRLVVDRALASLYRTARIRRIFHNWFGRHGEPLSPVVEAVYQLQAVAE